MIKIPGTGKIFKKVDEVIPTEIIPAITDGITITENLKNK